MKNKSFMGICLFMVFAPWTILPVRSFDWALESPAAEIMISGYAIWMVFSGIFTVFCYKKLTLQNTLMKICLVINGIYAAFGLLALGMIFLPDGMS